MYILNGKEIDLTRGVTINGVQWPPGALLLPNNVSLIQSLGVVQAPDVDTTKNTYVVNPDNTVTITPLPPPPPHPAPTAAQLKRQANAPIFAQMFTFEVSITPRRMRDYLVNPTGVALDVTGLPFSPGMTNAQWMAKVDAQITTLRAQLK